MQFPADLKYTKEHEWARVRGNTVVVGVTDHAQQALGDVVYVELPQVGRTMKAGETFGVVESIKAVSDLYSPLAGKVVKVNNALTEDPARINRSPYEDAWMIEIEVTDPSSVSQLMDAAAYGQFVQSLK